MKKGNIPVKHHYIPQFFLSNFTETGNKDSQLWVTDQKQCKQWKSSISTAAYQNKLYSLEGNTEGTLNEIDAIEKAFSKVESMAAPVIQEILKTERLPTEDGFNILINFIALMASRTPTMIEHRTKPIIEINEIILDMYLSKKERWQSLTSRMVTEGKLSPKSLEETNYDKMRDFFYSKRYTMDINQNYKIKQLLDSVDILIPLLAQRKWSLFISKDITTTFPQLGGFICSDNPMALVSLDPLPPFYSPGFGMPRTEVTMPLSKNVAIVGRFEGKENVSIISVRGMASMNSRTGMYADRFLYHSDKNFIMINQQQQICNVNDLLKYCSQNPHN